MAYFTFFKDLAILVLKSSTMWHMLVFKTRHGLGPTYNYQIETYQVATYQIETYQVENYQLE